MQRRQAWLIGVAVIAALLIFWRWHIAQNSPVAQVQRELERLRKMGEPISYLDLLPPVPSHLDATPLYRKAIAQLEAVQNHPVFQVWKSPPGSVPPGKLVMTPSPPPLMRPMLPVKAAANPQVVQLVHPALTTLRQNVYQSLTSPRLAAGHASHYRPASV